MDFDYNARVPMAQNTGPKFHLKKKKQQLFFVILAILKDACIDGLFIFVNNVTKFDPQIWGQMTVQSFFAGGATGPPCPL